MARTDPATREKLLEVAARVLANEGLSALSTRRLASEVGVSTMVVYTRFGSMPELMDAIVAEGFNRLSTRLAALEQTDDPIADIMAMADAYRANALENPNLYPIMYGAVATGAGPDERIERTAQGLYTFTELVDLVARAMEAGRLRSEDPAVVASQLWSAVHGFIMLELGGVFRHDPNAVEMTLKPMLTNLLVGLGAAVDAEVPPARSAARRSSARRKTS